MDGGTFGPEGPNLLSHLTRSVSRVCDQHFARFEQAGWQGPRGGFDAPSTTPGGAALSPWGEEANKLYGKIGCFSTRNGGLRGYFPLCPVEISGKK